MRRAFAGLAAVVLVGGLSGCTFNQRAILCREYLSTVNEMADCMAQIHDEESAKAFNPRLEKLADRIRGGKGGEMGLEEKINRAQSEQITKSEFLEIFRSFKDEINHTFVHFMDEKGRLSNPGAPAEVRAAWETIKGSASIQLNYPLKVSSGRLEGFDPVAPPGIGGMPSGGMGPMGGPPGGMRGPPGG